MLEKNAFPGTFEEWQNLSTDQKEYAHFSLIHQVCETVSNVQGRVSTLEEQMRTKNWKRGILSGSIQFVGAMVGGGAVLAGYLFLSGKLAQKAAASVVPAATQGGGNMIGGMEVLLFVGLGLAILVALAAVLLNEKRNKQMRKDILNAAQELNDVLKWWEKTDDELRQLDNLALQGLREEAERVMSAAEDFYAYNKQKAKRVYDRVYKILAERG